VGRQHDTVSFLTDYGLDDEFVGVVKSVIRDMAPHATVVDLTHGIRPFEIRGGSLALARAIPYVAEGVVLAVVDPGVGTARRALAIEVAGGAGVLVGPDNGLLAPAVAIIGGAERAVELTNPEHHLSALGATFAGRDVFAPVVAHLCNGVDLAELGPLVDADLLMPGMVPLPREEDDGVHTEVLWVDRFGNCQLNVGPDDLTAGVSVWAVTIGDERRAAKLATTYGELGPGSVGLVLDSHGMYSLSFDQRSAAQELRLAAGDAVVLSTIDDDGGAPSPGMTTPVALRRDR
jgi:S-adenosylmethionine hydrolase